MSGKVKVTKEMILDKALEITRKEGIQAVNARRLGKELNCSLQPIYYYLGTMDVLRAEIVKKANEVYNQYVEKSKKNVTMKFRAVGIAYLRFASEEKELFRLLFMRDAKYAADFGIDPIDDNNEYIHDEMMKEYDLSLEEAKRLHFEIWIATHGLATMIATDYMSFSDEQLVTLLGDYFVGLYLKIVRDRGNENDQSKRYPEIIQKRGRASGNSKGN